MASLCVILLRLTPLPVSLPFAAAVCVTLQNLVNVTGGLQSVRSLAAPLCTDLGFALAAAPVSAAAKVRGFFLLNATCLV